MHALLILLIILLIGLIAWEERHRATVQSATQPGAALPTYQDTYCPSAKPRRAEPDYSPLADPVIPERWRPVDIPINWAVDSGDRLSAEGPVPQAANIRVNFEPDHDVLED